MKKLIPLVLVTTLGVSSVVMAKPYHQGGFNDGTSQTEYNAGGFKSGTASVSTVEQVKNLSDDSWVTLKGNIIKQVGKKDYIFKDATGEIEVEIDHKRWRGQVVTPEDLVEITGEVDKDWNKFEVEVKQIKVLTVAE